MPEQVREQVREQVPEEVPEEVPVLELVHPTFRESCMSKDT